MSMSRLLLRAYTIQALTQQKGDAAPPTMAGEFVFDSKLDPFVFDQDNRENIPAIVIYTDDADKRLQNNIDNTGPYIHEVDLRIEIILASFAEVDTPEGAEPVMVIGITDAQMEAQLDIFEQQVAWALTGYHRRATHDWLRFVRKNYNRTSHPVRDENGSNKVSMRRLHWRVEITDDCPPAWGVNGDPSGCTGPVRDCPDFADFPAPHLVPMLTAMCGMPSAKPIIDQLGGGDNPTVLLPLLRRMGIFVDAVDPEADPNRLAALGRTKGPDERIEVQKIVEFP